MVRGGIERYLRAFPEGGFWRGKNYLFDKRMEQTPRAVTEQQPLGACAACGARCDQYRGKFFCGSDACANSKVPVLVCEACRKAHRSSLGTSSLRCRLCREGYAGASDAPLPACVALDTSNGDEEATAAGEGGRRRRRRRGGAPGEDLPKEASSPGERDQEKKRRKQNPPSRHVFVGNLPYAADQEAVCGALGSSGDAYWLADRRHRLYYGSAVVALPTAAAAAAAVDNGARLQGRKLRVGYYAQDAPPTAFFARGPRPPLHREFLRSSSVVPAEDMMIFEALY